MATLLSMYDSDNGFIKSEPKFGPRHRPQSLSALDVRQGVLEEIALKTLYLSGSLSVLELAERMCLGYEVVDALFCQLRAEQLCLVRAAPAPSNCWRTIITPAPRPSPLKATPGRPANRA
jgi:hypothetical protein